MAAAGYQALTLRSVPVSFRWLVLLAIAAHVAAALAAFGYWMATGDVGPAVRLFRYPGALLLVQLAAVEFGITLIVWREYSSTDAMHTPWLLMTLAAACHLCGALFAQLLSSGSPLNPLVYLPVWSEPLAVACRDFGLAIGGPVQMALLACGLRLLLHVYRRAGILQSVTRADWVVLALVGAYTARSVHHLVAAIATGTPLSAGLLIETSTDPLLLLLLFEAMVIRRSVCGMCGGLIGKCWLAYTMAIFLTLLGNLAVWATSSGFLPWPVSSLGWFAWLAAAAAYALAPAYQMEALRKARQVTRYV